MFFSSLPSGLHSLDRRKLSRLTEYGKQFQCISTKAQLPNGFPVSERNRSEKPNDRSVKPNTSSVSERFPFGSEHFSERLTVDVHVKLAIPTRSHVGDNLNMTNLASENDIRAARPAIFMGKSHSLSDIIFPHFSEKVVCSRILVL